MVNKIEYNENTITVEEFAEWKLHPVTKKMYNIIGSFRDNLSESLINGDTLLRSQGTAEETARIVGIIYGADLFLKAKYEDDEG